VKNKNIQSPWGFDEKKNLNLKKKKSSPWVLVVDVG